METAIKTSFICREISGYRIDQYAVRRHTLQAGDVGLFEILSIGKHTMLQTSDKTNKTLMPGDRILMAFGNRYATEQLEGYVPDAPLEEYHMLGQGGIVGKIASMHKQLKGGGPTRLRLVGLAVDEYGDVKNTRHELSLPGPMFSSSSPKVVLSVGSSMDSGKTTSAAYLVHGLKQGGHRVAFIKLTGTAFTKDADLVRDLGADLSIDFTELGYPSTYLCSREELLSLYHHLLQRCMEIRPDYIVIEIADGILQRETAALLTWKRFTSTIHHLLFSCGDSLSALGGVNLLRSWGLQPSAISGMITTSPLLVREAVEATGLPALTLDQLRSSQIAESLLPVHTQTTASESIRLSA